MLLLIGLNRITLDWITLHYIALHSISLGHQTYTLQTDVVDRYCDGVFVFSIAPVHVCVTAVSDTTLRSHKSCFLRRRRRHRSGAVNEAEMPLEKTNGISLAASAARWSSICK